MLNPIRHDSALVVEGGAMRSVFSAGLLDGFLQNNFDPFACYFGVSAGASNLAAFLARTPRASLNAYLNLALRKEFISYRRFLRGGHLIDLDWLCTQMVSESLLDIPSNLNQAKPFYVGLTDVASGAAEYVTTHRDNLASVIKASMALPLLYRGFPHVDGRPMTDGGVADGIPVQAAIDLGATRIMVVRSRSVNYRKQDSWGHRYIRWQLRKHAALVATMRERVKRHEAVMELISHPPRGVTIVDVCPPEEFVVARFSRDRERLLQGYHIGFEAAADAIARWQKSSELEAPSQSNK